MTPNIVWSNDFATGIDIIDQQHKRLFEYFEQIEQIEHCIASQQTAQVEQVCRGLIDYAISHNTFEESLMKQAGYPMLDAHHQVHEAFKKRVGGYLTRLDEGADTMRIAREVRTDIGLWLMNHILREDQHYVPYVKKNLNSSFTSRMLKRFFG